MADISYSSISGSRTGPYSGSASATITATNDACKYLGYQKAGDSPNYRSSTGNFLSSETFTGVGFSLSGVGPAAGNYSSTPSARGYAQVASTGPTYGSYKTFSVYLPAYVAPVTLDPGEGSGGTDNVNATYGSAMPAITIPTRQGYAFRGYFSEQDGAGTKYYNEDGTSARTADFDKATTLYAFFEAMSILHVKDGETIRTITNIQAVENGTVRKIIGCYSVENGVVRQGV